MSRLVVVDTTDYSDGAGGSYVLDGTQATVAGKFTRVDATHYRLDAHIQYDHLTLASGIYLDTNECIIDARWFTNNGIVDRSGAIGLPASVGGAGAAGGNSSKSGLRRGFNGGNGGPSSPTEGVGDNGENDASDLATGGGNGGRGGGNTNDEAGFAGGTGENNVPAAFVPDHSNFKNPSYWRNTLSGLLASFLASTAGICIPGGGGGGGGTGKTLLPSVRGQGGGGGGGGEAGGIVVIIAALFDGSGSIDVSGGHGGAGADGENTLNAGAGGGGGGGGGAMGGLFVLITRMNRFLGTIDVSGGDRGSTNGIGGIAGTQTSPNNLPADGANGAVDLSGFKLIYAQ